LVDFPRTPHQLYLLQHVGVVPANVFTLRLPRSPPICTPVVSWLSDSYSSDVLAVLDGTRTTSAQLATAIQHVTARRGQFNHYLDRIAAGAMVNVAGLEWSATQLHRRMGLCELLCPVCYVQRKHTVRGHDSLAMEFRRRCFFPCSPACAVVLQQQPLAFVETEVPSMSAFRLAICDAQRLSQEHVQLSGHCPVSLHQVLATSIDGAYRLVPGAATCGVVYCDQVFLCRGEAEVAAFLKQPHVYADLRVPAKVAAADIPKVTVEQLLAQNKLSGFLEQSAVVSQVGAALVTLDSVRLKHPALSVLQTALIRVALLIQATNPNSTAYRRQKVQQAHALFDRDCAAREPLLPLRDVPVTEWPASAAVDTPARLYDFLRRLSMFDIRKRYFGM
jgi:hypothetical protein